MKKQFLPYEEALALKELGFDEEVLAWYNGDKDFVYPLRITIDGEKPTKNSDFKIGYGGFAFLATPLYQQAFKWFRDKHKLPSWVYESIGKFYFKIVKGDFWVQHQGTIFNSYEEAELACIRELIKIVKDGK